MYIDNFIDSLSHTHFIRDRTFQVSHNKYKNANKNHENNNNDKNIFYYVLCSSSLSSSIIVTLRAWSVCAFIKWYHPHFISPIGGARGQKEKQTKARTFFFLRCVDVNISRATNWIDWMNWLTEWMSCLTEHRSSPQLSSTRRRRLRRRCRFYNLIALARPMGGPRPAEHTTTTAAARAPTTATTVANGSNICTFNELNETLFPISVARFADAKENS